MWSFHFAYAIINKTITYEIHNMLLASCLFSQPHRVLMNNNANDVYSHNANRNLQKWNQQFFIIIFFFLSRATRFSAPFETWFTSDVRCDMECHTQLPRCLKHDFLQTQSEVSVIVAEPRLCENNFQMFSVRLLRAMLCKTFSPPTQKKRVKFADTFHVVVVWLAFANQ